MYVNTTAGCNYLLACGDARVPYRTSLTVVPEYRSHAVVENLEQDFDEHGAPLVLRLDRAKAHRTPEVEALAARYGVLILHGPPHYPRYYGQLERQNREHRAWLNLLGPVSPDELEEACQAMRLAFNERWRRGTLDFRTASELWDGRAAIIEDRHALRAEVKERREKLLRKELNVDLAERLAIEQTLVEHRYLRIENGGWR